MVQVLTDVDLVISKSYICSDGGWFMDVFHVTDQLGNKITDDTILLYIQQAICAKGSGRGGGGSSHGLLPCTGPMRMRQVWTGQATLEIAGYDRPGLLSEISAGLAELQCQVSAAVAWTHKGRAACIMYLEDKQTVPGLAEIRAHIASVVEAHHHEGEQWAVRIGDPAGIPAAAGPSQTERRLHQLMCANSDNNFQDCCRIGNTISTDTTQVAIDYCKERGYSMVNVKCRDRPKLLFDTVCTLTDMEYEVFHASISSRSSIAIQEYYVRQKDGCTLNSESDRIRVAQSLIAAIERRVSHGLRLEITARNRLGLLSNVSRALRENGLSIMRAEVKTRGEKAIGSFYVTDVSGQEVSQHTVQMLTKEIEGTATIKVMNQYSQRKPSLQKDISSSNIMLTTVNNNTLVKEKEEEQNGRARTSLGGLLWAQLGKISSNFGPIKS
ncbi:ACT domain-containing protein ACR1 [Impatiens glandulifera]|uniref:ACT domain-containing protein ACR1 n=1 Tax=Impatiens glandulifera TaxID=253017 RepID=UPI001FB05506|nr:ACT domain-containing protein ACR1 [Impatiens glandulifera]